VSCLAEFHTKRQKLRFNENTHVTNSTFHLTLCPKNNWNEPTIYTMTLTSLKQTA